MQVLNKKFKYHCYFFILIGILLLVNKSNIQNLNELATYNSIFIYAIISISSIGIGHGALDGRIIWKSSNELSIKLKIYILYLLIVILALALWIILPVFGLLVLIIMSIYHFGSSDLYKYNNEISKKLMWGYLVTMTPIVIKPIETNEILKLLVNHSVPNYMVYAISIIFILCLLSWIILAIKDHHYYLSVILFFIIWVAFYAHPFVWFAYYFSFFHGIKALLNHNFIVKKDLGWIVVFTLPVLITFYLLDSTFNINFISLIFPALFSLTVAHMQLEKIIKLVSN
jgi:Brp/Blh family beta-carotene 15,15'-monooxygenase